MCTHETAQLICLIGDEVGVFRGDRAMIMSARAVLRSWVADRIVAEVSCADDTEVGTVVGTVVDGASELMLLSDAAV